MKSTSKIIHKTINKSSRGGSISSTKKVFQKDMHRYEETGRVPQNYYFNQSHMSVDFDNSADYEEPLYSFHKVNIYHYPPEMKNYPPPQPNEFLENTEYVDYIPIRSKKNHKNRIIEINKNNNKLRHNSYLKAIGPQGKARLTYFNEVPSDDSEEYYEEDDVFLQKNQNNNFIQLQGCGNIYLPPKTLSNKKQMKQSMHNNSNNTTTNNTYNNNIYYINPINVKNNKKNKNDISNKSKTISNKIIKKSANTVIKNINVTTKKKKVDYFKKNKIPPEKKKIYLKAILLIQSTYRCHLLQVKIRNGVNLYLSCKKGIEILEGLTLKHKKDFWKLYKNVISHKLFDNVINSHSLNSKASLMILKEYLKNKKITLKENDLNAFHKELGDSFNIINDNINSDKMLKNKLDDMIKENKELKIQLHDNKYIEEKLRELSAENKKTQKKNEIIMKDNQVLAKKLKNIESNRNKLVIQNQPSFDFTQIQKKELQELNGIYVNKLKILLLQKIFNKKNLIRIDILRKYFQIYKKNVRYVIQDEKNKYNNKYRREFILKKYINNEEITDNLFSKNLLQKYIQIFYYNALLINKEQYYTSNIKKILLRKLISTKHQKIKLILYKYFYRYYKNISKIISEEQIISKEEINKKTQEDEEDNKNSLRTKKLLSIFKKYEKDVKLLYKIFISGWNLRAKITGIRAVAKERKKKRKLKRKNNRNLLNKIIENSKPAQQYEKSIQEISYIVSGNKKTIIKDFSSSSTKNIGTAENKSRNKKINEEEDIKENKNKEKDKENEESEEESGGSFGLENDTD